MANSTIPESVATASPGPAHDRHADRVDVSLRRILLRLASLKLTVTLLSLAIILVVVGTLAQVEKDVWQVVDEYFRSSLAWVDFRVFFPPSFFPGLSVPTQVSLPGGFVFRLGMYFPGGWLIGSLLLVNLLAAFIVRFPITAQGTRLKAGWVVTAIGVLLTWLVINTGANPAGDLAPGSFSRGLIWQGFLTALGAAAVATLIGAVRLPRGRTLERSFLVLVALCSGGPLIWALSGGNLPRLGDSSLRILGQMFKGQLATFVLLVGCLLLYKRRGGLVLMHGGIALLMFGEVLTGLTAVEGQMQMVEGETTNFVRHLRDLELAIVERSESQRDTVIAVPESRLLSGETVHSDDLPFDIQLVHYLKNSTVHQAQPGEPNPATAGNGLNWVAEPNRPVAGTDSGKINMTAAYVSLFRKGTSERIGTYLVGLSLSELGVAEDVEAGGKHYGIALRHKRSYKPYSLKLVDVQKEDYPGTDIPRHYASTVHVVDESRHADRTVKIWMNNPLRFGGETLYQSGYFKDPQTGVEATTLAVVTNSGWMIPYVACMIVATGLIAQFGWTLARFLQRRAETPTTPGSPEKKSDQIAPHAGRLTLATRLVVPGVALLAALWLVGKARPPAANSPEAGLYAFGELPVIDHGRAKPVDSLARTSLQILSGKQGFVDAEGVRQPATRWFLDLVTHPERAAAHKVFRIEHPEILETLGLTSREGFRYSLSEFVGRLDALSKQVELALPLDPSELSTYQKKILDLDQKLALWDLLVRSYVPRSELAAHPGWIVPSALDGRLSAPLTIPVDPARNQWITLAQAIERGSLPAADGQSLTVSATAAWTSLLDAYRRDDASRFHQGVVQATTALSALPAGELDLPKVGYEAFYNAFEPCYHAAVLYVAAFLFAALAWLGWSGVLNRLSFGLVVAAFGLHLFVLVSRIYISGRPPVTNLYSSAIFIGWAAVLMGLIFELVYRVGIGNVAASVIGFATLLVAHFLGSDGDTFAVLQAVLDTQFWLATHVVCITLGYSATYMAGLLGILYVVRGVLTRSLTPEAARDLTRMTYGTLCFAILFSFVGTVLGGLWADDSWGRFWGWDPKENGALIIVLWNAMVLHALRGGLVKERGLALLVVAGNITVSWSWFGVNELGIGLHSYGFTEGVLRSLGVFVASQILIIALGLIPPSYWISQRRLTPRTS